METNVPSTKTHDALTECILKLAAEQVSLPAEQVSLDSTFAGDLGFDSLD